MTISDILLEIDAEIAKLQQVKAILSGAKAERKQGRPVAGSTQSATTSFNPEEFAGTQTRRRTMSPETRKKMADAQKRRWANTRQTEK